MLVSGSDTARSPRSTSERPLILPGFLMAFILVTSLFFLWGIPNNLNDILIKQFMKSFVLTRVQAGLVQTAFYFGYFVLAIPAALLNRRYGYKAGFLTGLCLYGTGALLFFPAAEVNRYSFFLVALFVLASGLSFLETSANPFITQFGPTEHSEWRLNFSQSFNSFGAIAGAGIGTAFILSGIELRPAQIAHLKALGTYATYLHSETLRVIAPYLVLGIVVLVLAVVMALVRFPKLAGEGASDTDHGHPGELVHSSHFLFAVLAQFLYVGAQVGTWSYFIFYVQDYTHLPEKVAGEMLIGTLAAFGAGRFLSSWWMRFIAPHTLMGIYSLINVGLLAVGVLHPGWVGMWAIFATSFFMSLMFPTIFALGLRGLGLNAKLGASALIMAIIGGAAIPPLMGWVSEHTHSSAAGYWLPLVAYVFVAYFSFKGSRMGLAAEEVVGS